MWNSGRRGDVDPERARCVRSDAARKRAALRCTRHGRKPPPSLLRRETKEYDRARRQLFPDAGSSSGASSSRSSLTPVKREPEEPPPVRAVRMEPDELAGSERRAGAVMGPEDFLPLVEADTILSAMLARSALEEEEERQRRRREEEIKAVLFEQGLASAVAFDEKEEEWRREKAEHERIFIDLTSDADSDADSD